MTESKNPVFYEPTTDTMAIEIRPWPGGSGGNYGGEDAGPDLVIHYAPDGKPWLWEIEHASAHPEHIAAALAEMRRIPSAAAQSPDDAITMTGTSDMTTAAGTSGAITMTGTSDMTTATGTSSTETSGTGTSANTTSTGVPWLHRWFLPRGSR